MIIWLLNVFNYYISIYIYIFKIININDIIIINVYCISLWKYDIYLKNEDYCINAALEKLRLTSWPNGTRNKRRQPKLQLRNDVVILI